MKIIEGDLLKLAKEGMFDVIIHQCNCFHNFGAGIALQIKKQFPQAFEADKNTTKYGDKNKLGSFSFSIINDKNKHKFYIVNGYSQFEYGRKKVDTEYEHVRNVFKKIKEIFGGAEQKFGYPLYGAGLAGGDWNIISNIIDEELNGEDHTLVKFVK